MIWCKTPAYSSQLMSGGAIGGTCWANPLDCGKEKLLPDPVKEVGEVEIAVVSGWMFVSKPKPPKKVSCGGPLAEPPCCCRWAELPCRVKPLGIVTRVR